MVILYYNYYNLKGRILKKCEFHTTHQILQVLILFPWVISQRTAVEEYKGLFLYPFITHFPSQSNIVILFLSMMFAIYII